MQPHEALDVKTNVTVGLFSPRELDHHWPQIEDMLRCVPHTWEGYTIEQFLSDAQMGIIQVWGVGKKDISLVYFTTICVYPAKRYLRVIWACGALDKSLPIIDASLEQFAKEQNCDAIQIIDGRGGWSRVMKKFGYWQEAIVLERSVSNERLN